MTEVLFLLGKKVISKSVDFDKNMIFYDNFVSDSLISTLDGHGGFVMSV